MAVTDVTAPIHQSFLDNLDECPGWSAGIRLYRILGGEGGSFNVALPHEDPCNNPYRATEKYWGQRREIIATQIASGIMDEPRPLSDEQAELAKIYEEATMFYTADRIERISRKQGQ